MSSPLEKLPENLRAEFETIRRRVDASLSAVSAQKIFNEFIAPIEAVLALDANQTFLASLLFTVGVRGKDEKPLALGAVSKALSRSREAARIGALDAEAATAGGEARPTPAQKSMLPDDAGTGVPASSGKHQRSAASRPIEPSASPGLERVAAEAEALDEKESSFVKGVPVPPQCFWAAQSVHRTPVDFDAAYPRADLTSLVGPANAPGVPFFPIASPQRSACAECAVVVSSPTGSGAVRHNPAPRETLRRRAALAGEMKTPLTCGKFRRLAANTAMHKNGPSIDAANEMATGPQHPASAQFPIPPPSSTAANFARACETGARLNRLRNKERYQ